MSNVKKVYFDVPSKSSTVMIEATLGCNIAELEKDVSRMMAATAVQINRKEYQDKTAEYKKED